jgi:four helix bundle protein
MNDELRMENYMKGDDISERLLDLGVRVVKLTNAMPRTYAGRHVANQLLRCGTGAGANYEEARGAESRADFVHKLGVAWKEVREAWYWLRLIHKSAIVKPTRLENLLLEVDALSRILSKSLTTAKSKQQK